MYALETDVRCHGRQPSGALHVPADSPYAQRIESEEVANTIHYTGMWGWINTSRDQIVGAFFGLCAAFDQVDDPQVKGTVSSLNTLPLR